MSEAADLLATSPHRALITEMAIRYALPPLLVAAMVVVESSGSTWTVRYEPGFFDRYLRMAEINARRPCSTETERRMCATSFGLLQVMGQVARERGYKATYLTGLCDPATGLEYGCKHLVWTRTTLQAKGKPADAASLCAAYNGGIGAVKGPGNYTNPEYPAKVLAALGTSWPDLA